MENFSRVDEYGFDKCLNDAFATSKLEKWNSNRDEICEVMPQYF